ncbi:hypothetical protein [Halorussus sp. AFM4]|uniref:hypothetical protein n=1 Tax=Halorussus sp. AFM4 TaxID=3421651 RepID=UPI003EC0C0E2
MNRGVVDGEVAVAVVVLLSVAAGGALFADGGVLGEPSDAPADEATTATTTGNAGSPTRDDTSDGSAENGTATPAGPRYAFAIESVESCGSTCQDVTARLDNTGRAVREDVRVATRVYADGDLLWSGNETVGRLGPDESHTSTRRVDVGFSGGLAISANGGYVTIVTVVRSEDGTARFAERRKVA